MELKLEKILSRVQKPARYAGGEYGQVLKDKGTADIRVALCFPDTYEIGMSNLGMRIIYGVLNQIDGVWCERVFATWSDMEEEMRLNGVKLYGLESFDPICDFDIIAFSVGYELSYTNILNMLDLAGVPIRAAQRSDFAPLVIAGGVCAFNPEPLSDFIDLFVIGEGEEVVCELAGLLKEAKRNNVTKKEFLTLSAEVEGVYVPSLYDVEYNADGTIKGISSDDGVVKPVVKRIVQDLDSSYFPVDTIVPSTSVVHDRVVLELFRGCIRGCRFCQAGHVCRPVRSRSVETLVKQGIDSLKQSGYDELALLSLSTSDYEDLVELCDGLLDWCEPRRVSISLPSLRVDNFSMELMERIQKVRKSGLTFAPEAGTQRLRDAINKNITEEDLLNTCRVAFGGGWSSVKLYFMLGLPTETDEDVASIAELAHKVLAEWKHSAKNLNRGVRITVSTSCFIPKPHTPFQWESQISIEEYLRRVELLRNNIKSKKITYNWHSPEQGFVEAAFARGSRELGDVIFTAWERGARLDSWSEMFSFDTWLAAFKKCEISPESFALRERSRLEILPWSLVSSGVSDEYLWSQREAAYDNLKTPDCREKCTDCGILPTLRGAYCSG